MDETSNAEVTVSARYLRVLKTQGGCSYHILRAQQEQQLLGNICRVLVEAAGYHLTWIGYKLHDKARSVQPVAQTGFRSGFLDTCNVSWDAADSRSKGVVGNAILSRQPSVLRNILNLPDYHPWRQLAEEYDYRSVAGFPLIVQGEVIGALAVYSADESAFDTAEVDLLSQVTADLGYGIELLRLRQQQADTTQADRGILVVGDGQVQFASDGVRRLIGRTQDELKNLPYLKLFDAESQEQVDARVLQTLSGEHHPGWARARLCHDDVDPLDIEFDAELIHQPKRMQVVLQLRWNQQQLGAAQRGENQPQYDPITHLPNRLLTMDRLERAMAFARRNQSAMALLMVEIPKLVSPESGAGSEAGDQLLQDAARRMKRCIRDMDTVGRLSRDQFLIVLPMIQAAGDAGVVALKLLKVLDVPFHLDNHDLVLHPHIGISLFTQDLREPGELLARATLALQGSRKKGPRSFEFFREAGAEDAS